MIRASQNPPMNENDPHTFQDLMYYLGREQYGEMPTFKRRYSQEPQHQTTYANYSSDLEFIWKYQMNHMYNRYIGWNFLGKESFDQDAGVNITKFYGIPLILILLGLYMHFKRDWKMATVFLFMFIIMGYMICYYQVQQEPQPRERIYFYAGAFFTFAAWISIAMREIIDFISKKIKSINAARTTSFVVIGLILILGPYTMFTKNYFTHDRSKNWLPWDYAYNILQSCAPNAVLFTCGDNDTFCLWYLQDVEGVRRDIRVANLSLINTNWYGKQLRDNTPYNTDKVAMNYTDLQIDKLQPQEWPASKDITLPVTPDVYAQFGIKDTSITKNSSITFKMPSSMNYGKRSFVRVQDLMIKDIVEANKWKRPIYFAITCGPDSKIGLDDYLVQEGMTERLVPYKKSPDVKKMVNVEFMRKQLFEENPGYSIDYKPGFKYRGLNDKSVFYDDNMERSIAGYRKSFITLARYYLDSYKDTIQCRYTIEKMQEKIPKEVVKYDIFSLYSLMDLYNKLGDNTYIDIAKEIETSLLKMLSDNPKNKGVSNELIRIRDIISGKQKPSREFDE
jgi:hypothetical protein